MKSSSQRWSLGLLCCRHRRRGHLGIVLLLADGFDPGLVLDLHHHAAHHGCDGEGLEEVMAKFNITNDTKHLLLHFRIRPVNPVNVKNNPQPTLISLTPRSSDIYMGVPLPIVNVIYDQACFRSWDGDSRNDYHHGKCQYPFSLTFLHNVFGTLNLNVGQSWYTWHFLNNDVPVESLGSKSSSSCLTSSRVLSFLYGSLIILMYGSLLNPHFCEILWLQFSWSLHLEHHQLMDLLLSKFWQMLIGVFAC